MAVGPGTILDQRYVVDEVLGSGGMGAVWRGHDTRLKRKVAIKVLRGDADPQLIVRFGREAEILADLSHPGITVVYDNGQVDGQFFIVMELHEGNDLAAVLAGAGGLPVIRTVNLALQAAEALAAAHGKGVVHRDIKPGNLFVVGGDRLKVCDFGIAKRVGSDWTRTQPGLVMGTPAYMSPEQCGSADAVDERSDLYSLGCVMYEMLAGHPPFGRGYSWAGVDRSHWDISPQPPRGIEPVPPDLRDLILGLVERDRDKRPPSAAVVAGKLQELKNGGQRGQQRRGREAPGAGPQAGDPRRNAPPPQEADPPRDPPPQPVTAEELRAMKPTVAADYLRQISSPAAAANALNGLEAYQAAPILKLLSDDRVAALLVALGEPVNAARMLAALGPRQAAIVASFRDAHAMGLILDTVPPKTAARLTAALEERFVSHALLVMDRDHALKVLDAMDIGRRKVVIAHLPSTGDARLLRDRAEARLEESEKVIRSAEARAQLAAARRRRQAELMPWTASVAASAALLVATTVAFDVGAAALGWESWPWLLLFIPATGVSAAGAVATWNARYTSVGRPALATALFLAASVSAVLLVTHVMAGVVGVPVVAVTPLLGIALVVIQLLDEGDHRDIARQAEGRGKSARDGDG